MIVAQGFAPPETFSTADVARDLDIPCQTLYWWVHQWNGPAGTGRLYRLGPVEVMVARAWRAIQGGGRDPAPACRRYRRLAEAAIRAEPRRWLLLTSEGASTHNTRGGAAREWEQAHVAAGLLFGRIIDLEPTDG